MQPGKVRGEDVKIVRCILEMSWQRRLRQHEHCSFVSAQYEGAVHTSGSR